MSESEEDYGSKSDIESKKPKKGKKKNGVKAPRSKPDKLKTERNMFEKFKPFFIIEISGWTRTSPLLFTMKERLIVLFERFICLLFRNFRRSY